MTADFQDWLNQNGLVEIFTTNAGDAFYANVAKGFGVFRRSNTFGVQSFYLSDIVGFRTKDDEKMIAEWNGMTGLQFSQRSTSYSTSEVYMDIMFRNQAAVKLQVFRATNGNISRSSQNHVNLYNYACQLSQLLFQYVMQAR